MKNDELRPLAYSVAQAAEALGVSRPKVYSLINTGGFPAFKLGGRTLVSVDGLRDWVARQVQQTANI